MARVLRILNLKIKTSRGWQDHEYDLDGQVVAIFGPADTGKSSILDAIGFAMGIENFQFRGAVHLHLKEVFLKIRLGNRTYALRRARSSSSRVEVTDEVGDLVGRFGVGDRRTGTTTMSDWLLGELGLHRDFSALGAKATFHSAVWPYLHRNQFDIDRHIVLPSSSDRLRLDALQIMSGIVDVELMKRRSELEAIDREAARRQRQCAGIADFLASSQATDPSVVRATLAELVTAEDEAVGRLNALRGSIGAASASAEQWRERRRSAHKSFNESEHAFYLAQREREKRGQRMSEIEDALTALCVLEEADPADRITLELVVEKTCPECEADLLDDPPPPGYCGLCRRPLKGQQHLQTRIRLQEQLQEADRELSESLKVEELAAKSMDRAHAFLKSLLAAHDEQAVPVASPDVDALSNASAELAALRQRITDLRQLDDALKQLDHERFAIAELRNEQQRRYSDLGDARSDKERRDFVAETLTDIFRRTIADIGLPHATGRARIDDETLLPLVDEQPFEARGGGARVGVSVAYSLALLSYTLQIDDSGIPSLLMIDSPQKNLGRNAVDRELARRVYQKFIDALQQRGTIGDGRFERPFQLIIVDNDKPTVRGVNILHELAHDDGFIKDLDSPHGALGEAQLSIDDEFAE